MSSYAFNNCFIYTGSTATADGAALEVGQYANSASLAIDVDELDATTFQQTYHIAKGGLVSAELSADILFDNAAAASDFVGTSLGVLQPLSIHSDNSTIGSKAWGFRALTTSYGNGAAVGELLTVPFTAKGASTFFRGISLGSVTDTATGTGTASQHVATAGDDTDKLHATLHVLTMGATTLDVKIQSDDNSGMTSATDRITFSQVSAPGSEFASEGADPSGGSDDYYRVSYTVGGAGTVTFVVALGIRST